MARTAKKPQDERLAQVQEQLQQAQASEKKLRTIILGAQVAIEAIQDRIDRTLRKNSEGETGGETADRFESRLDLTRDQLFIVRMDLRAGKVPNPNDFGNPPEDDDEDDEDECDENEDEGEDLEAS